jgi:hypothetical protein
MSFSEIFPSSEQAVRTTTPKQRLFSICYLSAVAVAMAGWLWAIGRVTLAAAKWLLA